jgi:hypothetical protein
LFLSLNKKEVGQKRMGGSRVLDRDPYFSMLVQKVMISKLRLLSWAICITKYLIDEVPSCPIFKIHNFGQILAVGHLKPEAQSSDSWDFFIIR